ncbi:MAG: hypothetical protein RL291_409 [Pseudomonadota bacterium]|jgi:uncharacterized membrane protein YhaH (DUF805 family)
MSPDVVIAQLTVASVQDRARAFVQKTVIVLKHAMNPRGRADRHGLFVIAVGLLILQIATALLLKVFGITLSQTMKYVVGVPMMWIGFATTAKRLHDVGRSAWMIPVAIVFWIVMSTGVSTLIMLFSMFKLGVDPTNWVTLYVGVFAVPAFGGLLWMHCAPGQKGANAYGAPTDESGFSTPPPSGRYSLGSHTLLVA